MGKEEVASYYWKRTREGYVFRIEYPPATQEEHELIRRLHRAGPEMFELLDKIVSRPSRKPSKTWLAQVRALIQYVETPEGEGS